MISLRPQSERPLPLSPEDGIKAVKTLFKIEYDEDEEVDDPFLVTVMDAGSVPGMCHPDFFRVIDYLVAYGDGVKRDVDRHCVFVVEDWLVFVGDILPGMKRVLTQAGTVGYIVDRASKKDVIEKTTSFALL